MKNMTILKAEDGKVYKNGNHYAKVVAVKNGWEGYWTMVDIEEAKANKAFIMPQAIHILKEHI